MPQVTRQARLAVAALLMAAVLAGTGFASAAQADTIPPELLASAVPHPSEADLGTHPLAGTADAATVISNPQRNVQLILVITDVFGNGDSTVTAAGRLRVTAATPGPVPQVTVSVNFGAQGEVVLATLTPASGDDWTWSVMLSGVVAGDYVTAAVAEQGVLNRLASVSTSSSIPESTTPPDTAEQTPSATTSTSSGSGSSRSSDTGSATSTPGAPSTSPPVAPGGSADGSLSYTGAGIPVVGLVVATLALLIAGIIAVWLTHRRRPEGGEVPPPAGSADRSD